MTARSFVVLAALVIGSVAMARADLLSINGSDIYNDTTMIITFDNPANVGGISTGVFAGFLDCTGCVTMASTLNYGSGFTPTTLFSVSDNGNTASVTLNSITDIVDNVDITGNATIVVNGVTTSGILELTTQGGGDGKADVTFSATNTAEAATPEPASLALFGTGLLGIVGIMARRKVRG